MNDNWIGIILPTKDGKYIMAKAIIIEDTSIESLKDAAIIVSDTEGRKEDLKYPFMLLQDIEILRQKLIEDIGWCLNQKDFTNEWTNPMLGLIVSKINKRFGVEE